MKNLILPVVLTLFGAGAGIGAGKVLGGGDHDVPADAHGEDSSEDSSHGAAQDHASAGSDGHDHDANGSESYVKFKEQFIVPVVENERLRAMVIMSLALEVEDQNREAVLMAQPKLRDAFLQTMLEHAALGGFSGNFTSLDKLEKLRTLLNIRAKSVSDDRVKEVFILEIARQDA